MNRNSFCIIMVVLLLGAAGEGCGDNSVSNANDIVFPASNVSYAQHVQPLFNLRCMNTGCHDDASRAGGLSLTSYFNLTANPGEVIPGDSKASKLAQKIDGRLPHTYTIPVALNQNQIDGIKKWIDEGAKNN